MEREKRKIVIAYILMILSVVFFFMGEYLVNSNPIIEHKYIIERVVVSGVLWFAGFYYLDVIEGRLERFKRR